MQGTGGGFNSAAGASMIAPPTGRKKRPFPERRPLAMPRFRLLRRLALLLSLLLPLSAAPGVAGAGVVVVPPGNRSAQQPPISLSSKVRTAQTKGTFDEKFKTIYSQLAADRQLIQKIEKAAAAYGIDPIHMVGAIVGEHTYNVDSMDTLQGYYVKALSYLGAKMSFAYDGEDVRDFIKRPQFAGCAKAGNDYDLWTCREDVWQAKFRGKTVDGKAFPNDRFQRVFFQPFFAGQTFGLGQLSPLTALTVSDTVAATSGLPRLDLQHPNEIYRAVMDPDMSLDYMAAVIAHDIKAYRQIAGFDISQNPGLTATLYNLGDAADRARTLAAENARRKAQGLGILYPHENYYGWLVNARLAALRKLL